MASGRDIFTANLDAARAHVLQNADRRIVVALIDRARGMLPEVERAAAEAAVDGNTLVPHDIARWAFLSAHQGHGFIASDDISTCDEPMCRWWTEWGLAQQPGCLPGVK